jgi:hypothetical protein
MPMEDQLSYYDAESLEEAIRVFEHAYGLDSDELFDAYAADEVPVHIPLFEAHVWASFVEDIRRLRGDRDGHGDDLPIDG